MVGPDRPPGEGWSGPSGRAIGHPTNVPRPDDLVSGRDLGDVLSEISGRSISIVDVLSSASKRRVALDRDDDSSLSSQIIGLPAFDCPDLA